MSPDCHGIASCKEVLRKSSLSATHLFTYMQTHTFTGILAHYQVHSIYVHVYAQERVCAHTVKHVYKMIVHTCECVCAHMYKHMCVYLCIHISFRWTLTSQHVCVLTHAHMCTGRCLQAHTYMPIQYTSSSDRQGLLSALSCLLSSHLY